MGSKENNQTETEFNENKDQKEHKPVITPPSQKAQPRIKKGAG